MKLCWQKQAGAVIDKMAENNIHEKFMKRALEEAASGRGLTGTNPLVGACLVKNKSLVGSAAHLEFGGPHAEKRLLDQYGQSAGGADLYCTLEPCVQEGKTPPCLPRVIESGVKSVILAHSDPNPEVAGSGIKRLVEEKIEVIHPVNREQYRRLNRAYFYRMGTGFPWVEVKLALSADGYIASSTHDSQWLNSRQSRVEVHRQRARADAVMVGANTVRKDDPRLTVRHVERTSQPRAIIVTAHPEGIPLQVRLLNERAEETIIVIPEATAESWCDEVSNRGVTLLKIKLDEDKFKWSTVLKRLVEEGIGCIFVEGGGGLAGSMVEAGVVNELHLFYCGKILGNGIKSFQFDNEIKEVNAAPEAVPVEFRQLSGDLYIRRLFRRPLEKAGLIDVYNKMKEE